MKLGEGGEAFFVFETAEDIPASLQTSPLVSPRDSPIHEEGEPLQEPEFLDLDKPAASAATGNKDGDNSVTSTHTKTPLRGARSAGDLG